MIGRINALLLVALVAFSAWAYSVLPDRVPTHFDLSGNPNRYGSRSSVLLLAFIGIATIAFVYVIMRMALRNPKLVNLPDKKRFLTLPEAEQRWVLEPLSDLSDYMVTSLAILFLSIEASIYLSATGHAVNGLVLGVLLITTIGMMALPIVMLVKIQKRLTEALRRIQMSGTIR